MFFIDESIEAFVSNSKRDVGPSTTSCPQARALIEQYARVAMVNNPVTVRRINRYKGTRNRSLFKTHAPPRATPRTTELNEILNIKMMQTSKRVTTIIMAPMRSSELRKKAADAKPTAPPGKICCRKSTWHKELSVAHRGIKTKKAKSRSHSCDTLSVKRRAATIANKKRGIKKQAPPK